MKSDIRILKEKLARARAHRSKINTRIEELVRDLDDLEKGALRPSPFSLRQAAKCPDLGPDLREWIEQLPLGTKIRRTEATENYWEVVSKSAEIGATWLGLHRPLMSTCVVDPNRLYDIYDLAQRDSP